MKVISKIPKIKIIVESRGNMTEIILLYISMSTFLTNLVNPNASSGQFQTQGQEIEIELST